MDTWRAAVIGLGMGASHVRAYQALPHIEVAAVCDMDEGRLSAVAHDLRVPRTTTEWQAICDLDVDLVSVCTPDHRHFEMAKRALAHGKHVVCEKPMTTSYEDAVELVQTVRATGRQLAVGNVNRYVPCLRALKAMLDQGRLGDLFMVEGTYVHDMRRVYRQPPWRTDPLHPQNAWYGGAVHPVDLVRWLAGDVAEIMLYHNKMRQRAGVSAP
ncbi:MAG: Gfo/Idh/MocA family oxidoreductase [Actinobacteria bacterium]|nr:Gfo/Idh/MocA family oxidoreductase [Actinomycetota bacterium]